jgi:superfamily II DNA or RNA helicase
MIVVCKDQQQARAVAGHLRSDAGYRVALAISDERDAHRALHRFRDKREGEILVTVYMAQEGLDVPDCTHLVALTPIRSRPWLEQALSRVTRVDSRCGLSWEEQCAYLYVPSDQSMVSFLSEWIEEQDARFNDPPEPTNDIAERSRKSTFVPISGEMTGTAYADTYGVFSEPDQQRIALIDRKLPFLTHLPAIQRLQAARLMWPDDNDLPPLSSVEAA